MFEAAYVWLTEHGVGPEGAVAAIAIVLIAGIAVQRRVTRAGRASRK